MPNIQETIRNSLSPRLESVTIGKNGEERKKMIDMFDHHTKMLADFIQREYLDGGLLTIDFLRKFHQLFYPPGYSIKAVGNDGMEVENLPGEWRKQILTHYITNFSRNEDISRDLDRSLQYFNTLKKMGREEILQFYMEFGKIHPFGDSNGTISSIIVDILCEVHGFKSINLLHIRFRDKNFLFHTIELYARDSSTSGLNKILAEIDRFHDSQDYSAISDICMK